MRALNPIERWGYSWVGLVIALALHVFDEAQTGFLPFYNALVESLRESWPWLPFPTFIFPVWIIGLAVGITILLALSPLVFSGKRWLRPLSYFLGVLMVANAIAHIAASLYLREAAPGVYSSPVLLIAAAALLVTTAQSRPAKGSDS